MTIHILQHAFGEVLKVADPQLSLPIVLEKYFPQGLVGNCLVVGAGKASASMADALEKYALQHWPQANIYGHVITRYGHDVLNVNYSRRINVSQASHPVPDQAGIEACKKILQHIENLKTNDICIVLISGGGSSLTPLALGNISLTTIQNLTEELLRCGAPVEEINVIRKHISAIQGGRLAQLVRSRGATVIAFIISDVIGDNASDIASGPCAADPSTFEDAMNIIEKYNLQNNPNIQDVITHLQNGKKGLVSETLKPQDKILDGVANHVFASAQKSLEAAANYCRSLDYEVFLLGDHISGESFEFAKVQADMIRQTIKNNPSKKIAWISGGETVVTIPKGVKGRGGRCSEFLLALLKETIDIKGLSALAADTDGIDGSEKNAGAFFNSEIKKKVLQKHFNIDEYLDKHDAYGFFEEVGALVMTGPTLTNVNDFRIVLWERDEHNNH